MDFQASKAFEHLDKLAYEIGSRLSGTRGEARAAEYIRNAFENYGLEVRIQEFRFVERGIRRRAVSLLMIVALLLTLFASPLQALGVWAVALAGWWMFPQVLPKARSANLIATAETANPSRTFIFMAHYDSARCKLKCCPEIVRIVVRPLLLLFSAFLLLRLLLPGGWPVMWALSALPLLMVLGARYASGSTRRLSPGANDNASGVAVMLELARCVDKNPPKDTQVIFVATGGEEQGLEGARKLARSGLLPAEASIINLDGVGFGSQSYYIEGNGLLRRLRTSPELNRELIEAGRRLRLEVKPWWAAHARHDHVPFLRKGQRATTLTFDSPAECQDRLARVFGLGNARRRSYKFIHTIEDLPDKLDPKTIETAGMLLLEFLRGS